ncbi:hypothetical protein ACFV83_13410 [Streptomyces pharetrae]|jgi:hypothetical protein|uniref:hypothetical protein n=1 Tax=Streptomyces pharetrae TaxID=291370 RepID=UPI003650E82E
MSRKRKHAPTLAETVAALPPAGHTEDTGPDGGPSPAGREEFVDDTGRRWRKVRGPLHPSLARRLVAQADEFIVGEGSGERLRHVPSGGRLPAWQAIRDRLDSELTPGFRAFEFRSAEGTTLLYVEESC